MSWQRRHCIECYCDMEHCATCGCHDTDEPMPVTSNTDRHASTTIEHGDKEGN